MPPAKDQLNYTTINHVAREELNLSWLEYGLADLIYRFSHNPKTKHPGWCYASKETLGKNLGVSKQSVHNLLNSLEKKDLIEREPNTSHIKTTSRWYETVEIVKKVYSDSKESLLEDSKESLHKNSINEIKREFNNIDVGTSIEDKNSTLEEEIKNLESSDRIRTEYQFRGLEIWENLKAPAEKKGSFIKVVRDENEGLVNEAYNFARNFPVSPVKWKVFFKHLANSKKKKEAYADH